MKRRSIEWHRTVYSLSLLYSFLSRMLPLKIWVLMGRCAGHLFYLLGLRYRRVALRNLRFAFGSDREEKEICAIARKSFLQFAMMAHEWIRLRNLDTEELKELIYVEGKENLIAAKEKNQSVILLGAHFGNWEYAHIFYSTTVNHLNFIVRAIDNPFLEKERVAYNQRAGVRVLYKENGLRPAIKNLRKGEDLVIFADQRPGVKEGTLCQFFGKDASTITLVPALAKKFHIPVVPMFIIRCKDLVHHRIIFFPELKIEYDDKNQSIREGAQLQNDMIEKVIRSYPDHWLWVHKRWRREYPYLYQEDLARRQRRREKGRARSRKV
jgi:KDO2-lipid IV(A) lauroyltransferase